MTNFELNRQKAYNNKCSNVKMQKHNNKNDALQVPHGAYFILLNFAMKNHKVRKQCLENINVTTR